MAEMEDFDVEFANVKDSTPEQLNGSVTTSGTPETFSPTSAKPIQGLLISVNSTRDPDNPNNINDALKFSIDGGTVYTTLMSGEDIFLPGIFSEVKLDSNSNGVNFQLIFWS